MDTLSRENQIFHQYFILPNKHGGGLVVIRFGFPAARLWNEYVQQSFPGSDYRSEHSRCCNGPINAQRRVTVKLLQLKVVL